MLSEKRQSEKLYCLTSFWGKKKLRTSSCRGLRIEGFVKDITIPFLDSFCILIVVVET